MNHVFLDRKEEYELQEKKCISFYEAKFFFLILSLFMISNDFFIVHKMVRWFLSTLPLFYNSKLV